jgi:AbrB family looped-hinge helix DNA binding protein
MWDNMTDNLGIGKGNNMLDQLADSIKSQLSKQPKNALVVDERGRVVIPHHIRKELGIKEGDTLIALLERGRLFLLTREQAIHRVREIFSEVPPEVSLVDQLLTERREDAEKEEEEIRRHYSQE